MGSVDPGFQPRARSAPEERFCRKLQRVRGIDASRFPRSLATTPAGGSDRVAGRRNAMSTKTSTAALASFGHSLFRIRRRAPRHPAGETIRRSSGHGFTACRKSKLPSFRAESAERGIPLFLDFRQREIPRFARNDVSSHFLRSLCTTGELFCSNGESRFSTPYLN